MADKIFNDILSLPITIVDSLADEVFLEAGRLKAAYRISLADSVALAEAKTRNALLVTTDHHEFDPIEKKGEGEFFWVR